VTRKSQRTKRGREGADPQNERTSKHSQTRKLHRAQSSRDVCLSLEPVFRAHRTSFVPTTLSISLKKNLPLYTYIHATLPLLHVPIVPKTSGCPDISRGLPVPEDSSKTKCSKFAFILICDFLHTTRVHSTDAHSEVGFCQTFTISGLKFVPGCAWGLFLLQKDLYLSINNYEEQFVHLSKCIPMMCSWKPLMADHLLWVPQPSLLSALYY